MIVTHQSRAVIDGCLRACRQHAPTAEVVVVDNASTDGTPEAVRGQPGVRLVANLDNRGFAAACNQGARASRAAHILLLNPDCDLTGPLAPLLTACVAPGTAAATGRLVNPDGSDQHGFHLRRLPTAATLLADVLGLNRLWPGNPINARHRYADLDRNRSAAVEQPAGALLLVRRDAWDRLGGMDEGYWPLWFEDVDFCRRLKDAGLAIQYVPEVSVCHAGAHSAGQLPADRRPLFWYGNLLRYAARHLVHGARAIAAAVWLVTLGRLALTVLVPARAGYEPHDSSRQLRVAYSKVLKLAWRQVLVGALAQPVAPLPCVADRADH